MKDDTGKVLDLAGGRRGGWSGVGRDMQQDAKVNHETAHNKISFFVVVGPVVAGNHFMHLLVGAPFRKPACEIA